MKYNPSMPPYPHIEQYSARPQELVEFGGSDNEENIRAAFQNCLDSRCRDHREKLVLVPKLKTWPNNKPDDTVKDSLRMGRGYWEAKDSHRPAGGRCHLFRGLMGPGPRGSLTL